MQKLQKLLIGLDIFSKNKFLRNIIILSILSVLIYPAININLIYPVMTKSIVGKIKNEAKRLSLDMVLSLGLSDTELTRDNIQGDLLSHVKRLEKKLAEKKPNLIMLGVYSQSGEIIYSSSPKGIGEIDQKQYFPDIVTKGIVRTTLLRKEIKLSEGQTNTIYLVETIIPIMRDNTFLGAFKIKYDITKRMQVLNRLTTRFSAFLYLVGFVLMSTITLMAFKMAGTEESLRESKCDLTRANQYLNGLIESSTDAIIATDRNGKLVLFNKGAEALSGYTREEVIGRRAPVLYEREEDAKEVMGRIREEGGAVSSFETTFLAKDGARIPVLISSSLLFDEDGQEAGTVGFSKDLRERKRSEEQLILAEKMAAVGRIAAEVSHEILNPLNIIILRLHTLIDNPDTPPTKVTQILRVMEKHANRITKITRDILSFSRNRGQERHLIDLNGSIKQTLSLVEYGLRIQNIKVEPKLAEELPPILGDQDQIQQVVLNLLTNAKDAMPDGGRLFFSTDTIKENGEEYVEFRVEDSGPGITPDHMGKLFDPFFTTKDEGEGTGLGLSICRDIIETHGGTIWAKNGTDGGASFVVRLPVDGIKV